ncbi:BAG family molecular chaperone regulator 7 [Bienertia sinuspersici]
MSYRKFEIIEHSSSSSPFFITETSIFPPKPLSLTPFFPPLIHDDVAFSLLDFPSPIGDLIQIETTPFCSRVTRRADPAVSYLKAISDRVNSLESKMDRLLLAKEKEEEEKKKKKMMKIKQLSEMDRKYSFTAEIKGELEKKYKWTAEIEKDDAKNGKKGERKYQWITEVKGKDDDKRTYTWKATIGGDKKKGIDKSEKKEKKGSSSTRIVEIEEPPSDQRAVVLRQAFAKRADKGKRKDLSPQDAAALIQFTFRAYLIRRSQALRALRELAVAKSKLKELRALFHNFSYRSRISRDAEERQKFSERIIVLLLTVDGIEGIDVMVRAAKRSMVDELEAMLDVVDPQPGGRFLSMKRRTFDMPSGDIQKEIADGVAQVVQMLDEEDGTFEACV